MRYTIRNGVDARVILIKDGRGSTAVDRAYQRYRLFVGRDWQLGSGISIQRILYRPLDLLLMMPLLPLPQRYSEGAPIDGIRRA